MTDKRQVIKRKNSNKVKELDSQLKPESFDHNIFSLKIRETAGGTIGSSKGALVKSNYLNQWLIDTRKNMKNPFIGKSYMTKATEYEVDDKIIDVEQAKDASTDFIKELDDGLKPFNSANYENEEMEPELSAIRQDDAAKKFIDHSIVCNVVKKLGNKSDKLLLECINDEFKKYYKVDEYVPPINIEDSIKKAKIDIEFNKMIENERKNLELISNQID